MDDFGAAGTGETSAFGPPRNPVDPARSAGGSSGGSGAAVRAGAVDLALGVDQGGSGRIPAAFCGVVAVKATHGLVPSFGITHIDHTIDFVTPIARTVADAALLLEVIAGADARDPQWVRGAIETARYAEAGRGRRGALGRDRVEESCDREVCEPAVLAGVDARRGARGGRGAEVVADLAADLGDALAVFQPYIACLIVEHDPLGARPGYGHLGAIDRRVVRRSREARREQAGDIAEAAEGWLIAERWLHERDRTRRTHGSRTCGGSSATRCPRARHRRAADADAADDGAALLDGRRDFAEVGARTSAALCFNTAPLNLTGHPAISVPSGADGAGLPTAVQLVSAHFQERPPSGPRSSSSGRWRCALEPPAAPLHQERMTHVG